MRGGALMVVGALFGLAGAALASALQREPPHSHLCACGTIWQHRAPRRWRSSEEFEAAHTCAGCRRSEYRKIDA